MPLRAIVFDFDGLILDTESSVFEAWAARYRELGHEMPRDRWLASIGSDGSQFDPLTHLRGLVGGALDVDALHERRKRHRDEMLHRLAPQPGVESCLLEAARRGLAVGLASSSERDWVEGHLGRLGLRHHFRTLRCREDVARVKPDPELYRTAVAALGVVPGEAVAIEDSPNGVAAAKAAGLRCVAVPGPMTRELAFDAADLVIDSLAAHPLEHLIARLS